MFIDVDDIEMHMQWRVMLLVDFQYHRYSCQGSYQNVVKNAKFSKGTPNKVTKACFSTKNS